jgi:hypothetical protein
MVASLGLGQLRFCWDQNKRFGLDLEHLVFRDSSSCEKHPTRSAGCGLNDVALDCEKASLGGKNPESPVAQVAFGPFKGFCVIRTNQHTGQSVAALIQCAAIPIFGKLGEDWSGTGDVFECSNLQVTAQWCRFDRCCRGLSGHLRLFWAGDDF